MRRIDRRKGINMFDDIAREMKKTELQKEFFKKCHEEGFTFGEMLDFDGYLHALMDYADDELTFGGLRG